MFSLVKALIIQPQQPVQTHFGHAVEHTHLPALHAGGDGQRRQGVPQIVLAITISPLAVLPGFAPDNAAQAEEKTARRLAVGKLLAERRR